jgi:hypothetical protein
VSKGVECIERGCLGVALRGRSRCAVHHRLHEAARRGTTNERGYDYAWQQYSRRRVAEVGVCQVQPCPYPDCGTEANPLTTDHVTYGLVLCRRANSAKQHADRRGGGLSKFSGDRP